jgi:DNA polymerase-3 subunit epsilon
VGLESALSHAMRTIQALSKLRIKPWPYAGPIAMRERDAYTGRVELHVIDRWRYLGTAYSEGEARELAEEKVGQRSRGVRFDIEIYRALQRLLKAPPRNCQVLVLTA